MRPHRRVDPARAIPIGIADNLVVQRFTHSVQALVFELGVAPHLPDRRHRMRVVRGELRIDRIGRGEHRACAGQVRDVGVHLPREHRVIRHAVDLRALDLGIPIRAFHQAHHEPVPRLPRQCDEPVDQRPRALLVRLDDNANAAPVRQLRIARQRFDQRERELQPVGFLGVDIERDVVRSRQTGQRQQPRNQLPVHARLLRSDIAWMQRRKLDRDARSVDYPATSGMAADRADRLFVRVEVDLGVGVGDGAFAQHVERIAIAPVFALARVAERLGNGATGDELAAEEAHRQVDALPYQRLAALAQHRRQRLLERILGAGIDQLAGDQQSPCGGINEQRRAAAQMRLPVAGADLVANQPVARRRVGDAQQRFGQTHQRDAFAAVERELEHQRIDAAGLRPRFADTARKRRGGPLDRRALCRGQPCFVDQRRHRDLLSRPMQAGDRCPRRVRTRCYVKKLEVGHGRNDFTIG